MQSVQSHVQQTRQNKPSRSNCWSYRPHPPSPFVIITQREI